MSSDLPEEVTVGNICPDLNPLLEDFVDSIKLPDDFDVDDNGKLLSIRGVPGEPDDEGPLQGVHSFPCYGLQEPNQGSYADLDYQHSHAKCLVPKNLQRRLASC